MKIEQQAVDKLYKSHFGKLVTAMLQFSRDLDLETAEDLVQDAFYSALSKWKLTGIPDNPAGWVYKVSRNNALSFLKRNKSFKNPFEEDHAITEGAEPNEDLFDDRKMYLLFACAHPRLSLKMQVVITLKYVANLRGESLAKALGMTSGQRLRKVELPLAAGFILAGLRTATVLAVGIATIAAAVGAGGLGEFIFRGVASVDNRLVLAGAIPAALLAIAADTGLGWIENRLKVPAPGRT